MTFDWVDTTTQAETLTRYYLINFNEPPIYVQLEVPFSYYSVATPLAVVKIKHPSLPTYFGSSSNTNLPHWSGSSIEPTHGYVLTRAKTYYGQIEGVEVRFDSESVPTLVLTCRLLLNPNDPTYLPT